MCIFTMMLGFCLVMAAVLAVIPNILWLLAWGILKPFGYALPYATFGWTALGLVLLFWILMAYGFFVGRWQLKVNNLEYANSEIPAAFDGFKIVHISDLHLSTFDDQPQQLQRFVDAVNEQNPDLICFTGDLVTRGVAEAEPYTEVLKSLKAKHGIVSVLGNHDFLIYVPEFKDHPTERTNAVNQLADYERDVLGWHLLRNENLRITAEDGSQLCILGIDNKNCSQQGFRTIDAGDLCKALEGSDGFRILLSHDPSQWDGEVLGKEDIPLTLSGHTHAAQFSIGNWTPASWMFKHVMGRYDENGQTLYVNIGLGCTAPFRLGAHPEITDIVLRSSIN